MVNSDVVRSYLGLVEQGKSNFYAIEKYCGDKFFKTALRIHLLRSTPTLRQRIGARAAKPFEFVSTMIESLFTQENPDDGVLSCGWLPLDMKTFAMSNGRRRGCRLLPICGLPTSSVPHSVREIDFDLERIILMVQRLWANGPNVPASVHLDSAFDSAAPMGAVQTCNRQRAAGLPQVDW